MDGTDTTFYSTAAQVIPVLFLTIVFETRGELRAFPAWELGVVAFAAFALVAGETAALHAVSSSQGTAGLKAITELAMIFGACAVFALLAAPPMIEVPWLRDHRPAGAVALSIYGLVIIATVFAITH